MSSLSSFQVNLIRGDIRQSGVEMRDLEDDLLDHICSAMEVDNNIGLNFEKQYMKIKSQICPDGYLSIQQETTFLLTHKYNKMKKTMNIFGLVGSLLLLTGATLKALHLAGAGVMLVLGSVILILCYFPMLTFIGMKLTDTWVGKIRNISGYLGASAIVSGVLLRILHWPMAEKVLFTGICIFLLLFIPLFLKSNKMDVDLKINPVPLSVLLLTIISLFFTFGNVRMSNSYRSSLAEVNDNITRSYKIQHQRLINIRESSGEKSLSVVTDETLTYIAGLKAYILTIAAPEDYNTELRAENALVLIDKAINDVLMQNNKQHTYNVPDLFDKIERLRALINKQYPELSESLPELEGSHFLNKPLINVYSNLSGLQLEIVNIEIEAVLKNS